MTTSPTTAQLHLIAMITLLAGCITGLDGDCYRSDDCPPDDYCRARQCVSTLFDAGASQPGVHQSISHFDDGGLADSYWASSPDSSIGEEDGQPELDCPDSRLPTPGDIVLTEILVFVPQGLDGDANGDGVRHAHDDEFLELVNVTPHNLDVTGITILNADTTRFGSPPHCLPSGHAMVVFGGIEFGAAPPQGPGFTAFISQSRFAFNNSQGTAVVRARSGQELIRFNYDRSPAESLTLVPGTDNQTYVAHSTLAPGRLFSPGTCPSGESFGDGGCESEEGEAESEDEAGE